MSMLDRRIGLLFAAFLALLGLAFVRTLYLGTVKGDRLAAAATTQQVATESVPPRRGTITDRDGTELAVSEPASDLSADPLLIKDPVRTAGRLVPILGVALDPLIHQLSRRDTGFVYLRRQLSSEKADRVSALHLAGITLTPSEHRTYPRRWLAAQVLGSVGTDDKGLGGLELEHQRALSGSPGVRRTVRDALGQTLRVTDLDPARQGSAIHTTLDAQIQDRVEAILHEVGAKYSPKHATAIVMDPRTSKVLAMANWPQVDANAPGDAPPSALEDLATNFTYEPGSTFKAFTVAGALSEHLVTPTTSFDLAPTIQVADRTIGEAEPRGYETLTTKQILAQSSNVGAITIGGRLGKVRFDHWIRRFGFGRPTGIDLPGEERGLVLRPSQYSGSSMGNLPIGQGELVTPIQVATAYSAIADGGVLRPPRVVDAIGGRALPEPRGHRVISSGVSAQLRDMLEGVFQEGGTAAAVSVPGYQLAGKTGTASKIDPRTGQYSQSKYVASFVGMAPARDPKLVIMVAVDEPQGAIYGAQVAAPAFGKIASFALPYLNISPR